MTELGDNISATEIVKLQTSRLHNWSQNIAMTQPTNFMQLVDKNHFFNYSLWKEEDKARRDDQGPEYVYHAKREIDQFNQKRNNMMEAMDEWLIIHLEPAKENCNFHTETPGMIIDRLSILNLKKYHMHLQTTRNDVSLDHHNTCNDKYKTICQQLTHLADMLDAFLLDIKNKKRSFRIYRQLKMYNDPNLNPQLYNKDSEVVK